MIKNHTFADIHIGTEFPGPGAIHMGQSPRFVRPVHIEDTITVQFSFSEIDAQYHHVTLAGQAGMASCALAGMKVQASSLSVR
jgi:acyl dehydratase